MSPRKFILIISIIIFAMNSSPFAQETKEQKPKFAWKNQVVGSFNLIQISFDNWDQGGENSLAWQFNLNSKFENEQKRYNLSNTSKLSYGKTKLGDTEARKSVDEMKLESVLTYKLGAYVNPYLALTAKTQFTAGYTYIDTSRTKTSDFLDPGYFTQSIGFGYAPFEELKTRLGFTLKETITKNFPVPYADDPKTEKVEKTKVEVGMESVTDLNKKLSENILLTSKLELFSNLERFDEIDLEWDSIFSAKVSKYINVSLNVKLLYDKDISRKRQLKEALTLGISYTFL